MVKKGTIVWYYDSKLEDWKRGKVTCVNRYHIDVRTRQHKVIHLWYDEPAIPASEQKPNCTPAQLRERWHMKRWWTAPNKTDKYRQRVLEEIGLA